MPDEDNDLDELDLTDDDYDDEWEDQRPRSNPSSCCSSQEEYDRDLILEQQELEDYEDCPYDDGGSDYE